VTGLVLLPIVGGGWWYFRPFIKPNAPVQKNPVLAESARLPEPKPAGLPIVQKPAVTDDAPRAADVKLVADEQIVLPARPATQPAEPPLAAHTEDETPTLAAADPEPNDPPAAPQDPVATRASSDARTDNRSIGDARKLLDGLENVGRWFMPDFVPPLAQAAFVVVLILVGIAAALLLRRPPGDQPPAPAAAAPSASAPADPAVHPHSPGKTAT
jgi:hypothetical protein